MSDMFEVEDHGKLHVLYGGTKIVQHSPPDKYTIRGERPIR